jgi:hypothetical protein
MALNSPTTPIAQQQPPLGGGSAPEVYRVMSVARLTVRLEDFTNDDGNLAQSETQPAHTPTGRAQQALADQQALQAVRRASNEFDVLADAQVKLAAAGVAGAISGASTTSAAAPNDTAADPFTVVLSVVPTELNLVLNGLKSADQLRISLPLDAFPIDPALIRSLFVELFIDEVAVDDLTDPTRWLPKVYNSPPLFRGYAPQDEQETDESSLMITIEAESLEKRLMDLKINPFTKARRIAKGGDTIVSYVQRLISTIPEFNGKLGNPIGVRLFPNVAEDQVPRLDAKLFKKSLQSAQSRNQAGGLVQPGPPPGTDPGQDPGNGTPAGVGFPGMSPAVADISVWDVVWRACVLSGVMPVYDPSIVATLPDGSTYPLGANNILLIPPQNIMETPDGGVSIPGGPVDGFSRDILLGSAGTAKVHTQVRFFVWGHNIKRQKVTRKYGRTEKVPRVRCIAHNPDAAAGKRTLTSIYPSVKRGTAVSARGSGKSGKGHAPIEEEVVRIFHDIRSQAALDAIAVATYASIGRREIHVTIETDNMASYFNAELGQRTLDVLRLRSGTPCRVTVADQVDGGSGSPVTNSLSDLFSKRGNPAFIEKAILRGPNSGAIVAADGWSGLQEACRRIETAYQSSRLTDWFYTKCVEIHGSSDAGFSASVELVNYVEARNLPANLSPQDHQRNNAMKAVIPGVAPDPTDQAIADRTDAAIRAKQGFS